MPHGFLSIDTEKSKVYGNQRERDEFVLNVSDRGIIISYLLFVTSNLFKQISS